MSVGHDPFASSDRCRRAPATTPLEPRSTGLMGWRAVARTGALALACLALWPQAGMAAPDTQSDAVSRFLAERGLVEAPAAPAAGEHDVLGAAIAERGLMDQVRDKASDMVMTAMNFLGVPYRRGGNSAEEGFDCSGFTRHIFERSLGLVLPRRADDQASAPGFIHVAREELKPGDLVFFNTLRRTFSHVGIYVGDGKFIHSPRSGASVRVEDMRVSYWTKRFTGARRPGALAQAGSTAGKGDLRTAAPAAMMGTAEPVRTRAPAATSRDAYFESNRH